MKRISKRLTYANVMSSLAVFLVLGGGAAFAAVSLPKNSVGTRELKPKAVKTGIIARNAVRTGKLKFEAVKAGKLAKNAVSTNRLRDNAVETAKIADAAVTNSKLANDSVTGDKVNESTLGQVPSAATAGNASAVDGNAIKKVFYQGATNTGAQTALAFHGLTLTASCSATNQLSAVATTSVGSSMIHSGGTGLGNVTFYVEADTFNPGNNFDFLAEGVTASDSIQGSLTYAEPNGNVVSVTYQAEESGANNVFGTNGCTINGYAIG